MLLTSVNTTGIKIADKNIKQQSSTQQSFITSQQADKVSFSGNRGINDINYTGKAGLTTDLPHNNPVIVVPGTSAMGADGSASGWNELFRNSNLALDQMDEDLKFPSIKDGKPIQDSVAELSHNINLARLKAASNNLSELEGKKNNPEELRKFFGIKGKDRGTEEMVELLPEVITEMDKIIDQGGVKGNFSTRIKRVEDNFADKLVRKTSFANDAGQDRKILCKKAAGEVVDSIAPKAIVAGLSLGGVCSYAAALNPVKENNSGFATDAGNGISYVIMVAAPVRGMPDIPKGVADAPGELLSNINPMLAGWAPALNAANRTIMESSKGLAYRNKPGWKQVRTSDPFTKQNITGKKVPDNVSVISFYHLKDSIVEPKDAQNDESNRNTHNIAVNFPTGSPHNMTTTRGQSVHNAMGKQAKDCNAAFAKKIVTEPAFAEKILDIKNSDDLRRQCLGVIAEQAKKDSQYLDANRGLKTKLESVQNENMPFKTSPSHIAGEILNILKMS